MKNEVLVQLRGKRTQQEMADLIGVPRTTYAGWETGRRKLSVENAKTIGKVFKKRWTIFFTD